MLVGRHQGHSIARVAERDEAYRRTFADLSKRQTL
jgi:hypothetical protein